MGEFSKGGVHKTDGLWWVSFRRGGGVYTKPMDFHGFWEFFYGFEKLSARGVYFGKYGILMKELEINKAIGRIDGDGWQLSLWKKVSGIMVSEL